jgi:amidase
MDTRGDDDMNDEEYRRLSAVAVANAVAGGEVSALEVVEAALRRIEQVDESVRAFREVWPERARAAAQEIDRASSNSSVVSRSFLGVPVAVKGTGGWQVERLKAAGAVAIGSTAGPGPGTGWQTWGLTSRGPTLNPWNPAVVPGGSSAGSAVAVATSMVPLATGSDGAGSIRIPAAWCGVLGLKPTNGTVPAGDRTGLRVGGALARDIADLWAYLSLVKGSAAVDAPRPPLRVAWSADLGFADTVPEVAAIAHAALAGLVVAGSLEEVDVDVRLRDPEPAWTSLRRLDDRNRPLVDAADDTTGIRTDNDRRLRRVFESVDLIATPTTPNPAHGHDGPGNLMSVALTWGFNLSGHPAISVPAGLTAAGAPVGLLLVARHHQESDLLQAADRSGSSGVTIRA